MNQISYRDDIIFDIAALFQQFDALQQRWARLNIYKNEDKTNIRWGFSGSQNAAIQSYGRAARMPSFVRRKQRSPCLRAVGSDGHENRCRSLHFQPTAANYYRCPWEDFERRHGLQTQTTPPEAPSSFSYQSNSPY